MQLSELKKKRKIKEIPIDKTQIKNLIGLSKRDLKVAKKLLGENLDWSFLVSYNAVLQISRAFMFSFGYTTDEFEHHKTTFIFVSSILGEKEKELINIMDRMRRKRHEVAYDEEGMVSEFEANQAFETAKRCMDILGEKIKEKLQLSK
jgi:uncharacterized protein (UPF0332 family)